MKEEYKISTSWKNLCVECSINNIKTQETAHEMSSFIIFSFTESIDFPSKHHRPVLGMVITLWIDIQLHSTLNSFIFNEIENSISTRELLPHS